MASLTYLFQSYSHRFAGRRSPTASHGCSHWQPIAIRESVPLISSCSHIAHTISIRRGRSENCLRSDAWQCPFHGTMAPRQANEPGALSMNVVDEPVVVLTVLVVVSFSFLLCL